MAFLAGQRLSAQQLNDTLGVAVSDVEDAVGTLTATAYTATLTGGTACGVVFTAPLSGKIEVLYNSLMQNSAAGVTYSAPQIREGSTIGTGTLFLTADDTYALTFQTNANTLNVALRYGGNLYVSGLVAGRVYNVQLMHRVTAGTGTVSRKRLSIEPTAA